MKNLKELIRTCSGKHQGKSEGKVYCKIIPQMKYGMCRYQSDDYVNVKERNIIVRFGCEYKK